MIVNETANHVLKAKSLGNLVHRLIQKIISMRMLSSPYIIEHLLASYQLT